MDGFSIFDGASARSAGLLFFIFGIYIRYGSTIYLHCVRSERTPDGQLQACVPLNVSDYFRESLATIVLVCHALMSEHLNG